MLLKRNINLTPRNTTLLMVFSIILVGSLIYSGCLALGILYDFDDLLYIFQNPFTDGINWSNIKGAFTTPFVGNYAPLHILSYALEYIFWPDNPQWYHLTNVLLHLLNAVLLFFFIRLLTKKNTVGLFTALIFLLHPGQVESVAWLSERKNLLSATFFLLSFLFYFRFSPPCHEMQEKGGAQTHRAAYILSLLFFLMALLTKCSVVIMPLLLVIYHRYFRTGRFSLQQGFALIPFFLLSFLSALVTLKTQSTALLGLFEHSLPAHLYMMLFILGKYLRLLFLPVNLSFQYDIPLLSGGWNPSMAAPILLLILFVCLSGIILKKNSRSIFWVLWFLICLLPVSQIVPIVTYMNDRYLYLPLIGIAALAAIGIEKIYGASRRNTAVFLVMLIVLCFLSVLTAQRIRVWVSPRSLWEDAQRKAPGNHLPHVKVGIYDFHAGRYDRALKEFQTSKAIRNKFYDYEWLGNVYGKKHQWQKAIENYNRALKKSPESPIAWRNLGIAQYNIGKVEVAITSLEKARDVNPKYVRPYLDLGMIYQSQKKDDLALTVYRALITALPDKADGWIALADYFAKRQNLQKSRFYLKHAQETAKQLSVLEEMKVQLLTHRLEETLSKMKKSATQVRSGIEQHRLLGSNQ